MSLWFVNVLCLEWFHVHVTGEMCGKIEQPGAVSYYPATVEWLTTKPFL